MTALSIRLATFEDAEAVARMLSHLAYDIGDSDHFEGTPDAIRQYGFGEKPMFQCFIAEDERPEMGLALFFPIYSTTRGRPGVYVQDLWTAKEARGQGLGRRLLAEVAEHAAKEWDAVYLSLTVYSTNHGAKKFYSGLGFTNDENDKPMALDGDDFERLRGEL